MLINCDYEPHVQRMADIVTHVELADVASSVDLSSIDLEARVTFLPAPVTRMACIMLPHETGKPMEDEIGQAILYAFLDPTDVECNRRNQRT